MLPSVRCLLIVSALVGSVLSLPIPRALGLPASQVSRMAKAFTVLVDSQDPGTGVIIQQRGKTFTVLTAAHVVEYPDLKYSIHAPDQQVYPVNYKTVKKLPGIDLALLEFTSDRPYPTAIVADSDTAAEGTPIYIAGYPDPGTATVERIFQFTSGEISARPTQGPKGYLMHYTNITRMGMSGGPVLNSDGKLIGIHGLANTDETSGKGTGINLGIPINQLLPFATKLGLNFKPTPAVATPALPPGSTPNLVPTASSTPIPSLQLGGSPTAPSLLPQRPKPIRPSGASDAGGGSPVCAGIRC
jgi:serine protease Do